MGTISQISPSPQRADELVRKDREREMRWQARKDKAAGCVVGATAVRAHLFGGAGRAACVGVVMKWEFHYAGYFAFYGAPAKRTLSAFWRLCDEGEPGRYALRAGDLVLATAKVKRDEMDITWHRGRIFYALGQAGALNEVAKVERFLAKEDA